MNPAMSPSEKLAQTTIGRCLEIGVREFAVCAGSRNSPLVLEILRCEARVWPFFEERSAAFFALGRCRDLMAPVAVVTTSGTAAAELFPALIEATYLRAPLLCITADRPKAFRNSGAPQAIEQAGIFCMYARDCWDVEDDDFDLSRWDGWGPAHLNICLDEPLVSATGAGKPKTAGKRRKSPPQASLQPPPPNPHPEPFILPDLVLLGALGRDDREPVRKLLAQLNVPILADATSCLREASELQPWMLRGGENVLKTHVPRRVLRIGGVPSCRFWRDLEDRPEIDVVSLLARGFSGLARKSQVLDELPEVKFERPGPDAETASPILEADRSREPRLTKLLDEFPLSEPSLIRALSRQIAPEASIFLGNSLPIREWNLAATFDGRGFEIRANRGANGIDGNLSTFLGLTADAAESWGVFGDLTALYDLAAPWILRDLPQAKRRFVVINNGGGRIFSRLPVLGNLPASTKRITENSHDLNLEHWAKMWRLGYRCLDGPDLPRRLPREVVLELRPDSGQTERFWQEFVAK